MGSGSEAPPHVVPPPLAQSNGCLRIAPQRTQIRELPEDQGPFSRPARVPLCSVRTNRRPRSASGALSSIKEHRRYEAGGSVLWTSASPSTEKVPLQDLSWARLKEMSSLFQEDSQSGRVLFPVTVIAFISSEGELDANSYPSGLGLVTGHAVVCAWWTQVFEALKSADDKRVAQLWSAALTATVRLRLCPDPAQIVQFSMRSSAAYQKKGGGVEGQFHLLLGEVDEVAGGLRAPGCEDRNQAAPTPGGLSRDP